MPPALFAAFMAMWLILKSRRRADHAASGGASGHRTSRDRFAGRSQSEFRFGVALGIEGDNL